MTYWSILAVRRTTLNMFRLVLLYYDNIYCKQKWRSHSFGRLPFVIFVLLWTAMVFIKILPKSKPFKIEKIDELHLMLQIWKDSLVVWIYIENSSDISLTLPSHFVNSPMRSISHGMLQQIKHLKSSRMAFSKLQCLLFLIGISSLR